MADIFVSYARVDKERVEEIVKDLQSSGHDYWMDILRIQGGNYWPEAISKAILECRIFLLFMSPASMASHNVTNEVQIAFEERKVIVILMLEDAEIPPAMRYQLAGRQRIDYKLLDWRERTVKALENPDARPSQAEREPDLTKTNGTTLDPGPEDRKPSSAAGEYQKSALRKLAIPGMIIILLVIALGFLGYRYNSSRTRVLWNFKENAQTWLPQVQTKPEDTATNAQWNPTTGKLQMDFDFKLVQPGTLSGDVEPRATYYVKVPLEDWSAFRSLAIDMNNLSAHDLKVNFSVSQGGCWYEFGGFQNLPMMSQTELKFDLTKPYYKTCEHGDKYAYPAPPFNGVWSFDIILSTDEKPYRDVNGSILIDNVRLTDRASNFIQMLEKKPIPTSTATMELPPTNTPTMEPSPSSTSTEIPPTFTVTPYICPYQGKTDEETIVNLIEAEAAAVNTEDLVVITVIFAPNAIFRQEDTKPPKIWEGPIARYQEDLFANTDLKEVEHFDILPAVPLLAGETTAYFTSGSRGKYLNKEGVWADYFNGSQISPTPTQYGSDHWTLKKDEKGCWLIVQMDFNAGHVKFP